MYEFDRLMQVIRRQILEIALNTLFHIEGSTQDKYISYAHIYFIYHKLKKIILLHMIYSNDCGGILVYNEF